MKRSVLCLCLLVGCGFSGASVTDDGADLSDEPTDDAMDGPPTDDGGTPLLDAPVDGRVDASIDAMADAMIDAPPPQFCVGTGIGMTCVPTAPTTQFTLPAFLDTGGSSCHYTMLVAGVESCVFVGTRIGLDQAVRVTGSRPLVLLSETDIDVSFTIGASSRNGRNGTPVYNGPGAPGAGCVDGTLPETDDNGSGGGPGGSGVTRGGNGGSGDNGGSAGGTASSATSALVFRAGCRGRDGGNAPGTGGNGGGAIYLAARGTITIGESAGIGAGGAGGIGGDTFEGGGGGGSGGFIGLDAPTVTGSGLLVASGGGGGEGGGADDPGASAQDGTDPDFAAAGGDGNINGGNGGSGGSDGFSATSGNPGLRGGGGGGGGVGRIYIRAMTNTYSGNANPAPTEM